MALVLNDRVKETSTSTGTGTINLAGAVSGFEGFVAGIGNSNTTYYAIAHQSANEWEVGLGTITDASPDTLTGRSVISSSNSDSAVDFSAGTKDVFCTYPAGKAVFKDASNNTNFADDEKIVFGAGADLEIFHETAGGGTDNVIKTPNVSHSLRLKSDSILLQSRSNDTLASFSNGGNVTLAYSGSGKISTTNTGVQTTGTVNINGEYEFPTTDGNANQILETDGSGALTFVDKPTSGASAGFVIAMAVAL
jgi:hypothetical protein